MDSKLLQVVVIALRGMKFDLYTNRITVSAAYGQRKFFILRWWGGGIDGTSIIF